MRYPSRVGIRALSLFAAAAVLGVLLVACANDPYSGTWQSTALFNDGSGQLSRNTLVVAKSGDGWTVTDPLGRTCTCRETGDGLALAQGPSGPVEKPDILRRDGNELVLFTNGDDELMRYTQK